jgi:CubicO group peptidase (beta-lactamase class C family)
MVALTAVPGRPSAGAAQNLASRFHRLLTSGPDAPFNGVVLVAHGSQVLFERAYGLADADLRVPNAVTMRFGIGSLTKPITAVAVMRLVERGALRLADPVCDFLRACPAAWREVRLRHLLSHTSGIPDLFSELPAAPVDSTRAVIDAAIARHMDDTVHFRPGERYAYSNFNYFLVGYVLETVVDLPWEAVLRREVFEVAGMTATAYDDVWRIMPGRVRGYRMADGELHHIRYRDHAAYAAGGLLSTAGDLLAFDRGFSAGRLVADSIYRLMTTPGPGDYGLGWQIVTAFGRRLINHTGGTNGFSSHLAQYDDGTVIIVLRNVEGASGAKAIACDLAALRFGLTPTPRSGEAVPCRP